MIAKKFQTVEQSGIILLFLINRRNSEERKDAYGRVLPIFFENEVWPMAVWASPRDRMGIS
jgi:hypothetical protein